MTTVVCDGCEMTLSVDSLSEVAEDPVTGEALCDDCESVECNSCHRSLRVGELTEEHAHEGGGWVCDTCPRVEYPYEFDLTFKREVEGYVPHWMDEIFPDPRIRDDYNVGGLSRDFFRFKVHVTFRLDENGIEAVALNGERISDD